MGLTKQFLRRTVAAIAGDYMLLSASANGASNGSTIVLAGLDGTEDGRKRWIVKHLADEPPVVTLAEDAAPEAEPVAELAKELLEAEEAGV